MDVVDGPMTISSISALISAASVVLARLDHPRTLLGGRVAFAGLHLAGCREVAEAIDYLLRNQRAAGVLEEHPAGFERRKVAPAEADVESCGSGHVDPLLHIPVGRFATVAHTVQWLARLENTPRV